MNRKLIATVIAGALVFGQATAVFAEPVSSEQQLQQERNEFKAIEEKVAGLEGQLYILDEEIGVVQNAINENNNQISAFQVKIKETEEDIEVKKAELLELETLYGSKMRAFYKNGGQTSYISILLDSEGFTDLIARVQAIGKLLELDKKIINEVNEKKEELDNTVKQLDAQVAEVESLKQENEEKLAELDVKQEKQQSIVNEAKAEMAKIEGSLEDKEYALVQYPISVINNSNSVSELRNTIETLRGLRQSIVTEGTDAKVVDAIEKGKSKITQLETPQYTPSRGDSTASASASALISYAYKFLGVPYVYGGTTPRGFDCSGFTQYVFAHFGYNITRTTYSQINVGRAVSRAEMQPGDLVFTHAGHVGIYIGNNQFIHAPHTGDVVKVSSVYAFYAARRVL
ncbi:NlpC/P60 family protein [Alloiococcus sp. CFN-8]|uniref:C40 family peptidase n=1 Tax=Alloiococcus sp. CFN-8 TaxID=3416081 RepID=UPI003CEF7881